MSCSKIDRFLFSLSSHRNFADFPAFDQPHNFPSPIFQFVDATPSGSTTTSKYPFNSYYRSRRCQTLYLAQDLHRAGAKSKHRTIVAIQLKPDKHPRNPMSNFRLEYRIVSDDSSTLGTHWYATDVCYGPRTVPVSELNSPREWTTFKLTTPIKWDGISNILVQFSYNGWVMNAVSGVNYS